MTGDQGSANDNALGDQWAAERSVGAVLEKYGVILHDEIPPEHFVLVAARINQFRRRPITDSDMEDMKQQAIVETSHRRALNRAANILREDIKQWRAYPSMAGHIKRWEEAEAVLRHPRGAMDNSGEWLSLHNSKQGPAMKGWTYMAVELAISLLPILRKFGVKVSLGKQSGIVKFIQEALRFIGTNQPPSTRQISERLQENLNPTKTD